MPKPEGRGGAASGLRVLAASLGIALALVVLLEGVLRLAGVGAAGTGGASRLPYQRLVQPVLRPGRQADGTEILVPADPRLPYQWVRRAKPEDALRVIVFGGSAAAGLGYSPNVTFARHLERLLRRAYPERTVEVLNLGITALASTQVKELVREACERYEPDVLVVYSGNNEFLESHARKYARAHAGPAKRVRDALRDTNLARLVQGLTRSRRATSLAELRAGESALRLTQSEIIADVTLTRAEVDAVVERYARNVVEIARAAEAASTPLILMTVASNWQWRGMQDLPPDWSSELVAGGSDADVLAALDRRLESGVDAQRHEWLFQRATLLAKLGRHDEARRDYRAALNADPHLRRALASMNDRLREVTGATTSILDTVELLAMDARHATPGFDEFYDYVHFTPRGSLLVGTYTLRSVRRALEARGPRERELEVGGVDPLIESYTREELAALEPLEHDHLDAQTWLGVGLDPERVHDRDLWKYERMLEELDRVLAGEPDHLRALVYRGNARSFRLDGSAGALADWTRALELGDPGELDPVRDNVTRLLRERDVSRP